MSTELVVGRLTDADRNSNRSVLGPWSLLGNPWDDELMERLVKFDAPIASMEEMSSACNYVLQQYHRVLPQLAEALEQRWGESHCPRFWEIVLTPWVIFGMMILYERERRIEQFLNEQTDGVETITLFGVPQQSYPPEDVMEFIVAARSADLNGTLCAWIFRNRAQHSERRWPKRVEVVQAKTRMDCTETPAKPRTVRRRFSLRDWIDSLLPVQHVYGMGASARIQFSAKLFSLRRRKRSIAPRASATANATSSDSVEPFRCDPVDFLSEFLPRCYRSVDGLRVKRNWLLPAHSYIVSTGMYFNEGFKYALAQKVEKLGAQVVSVQHGGGYGTILTHPLIVALEYRQDRFVTWGWVEHSNYEVQSVPLPSPMLSRKATGCQCCTNDIIFVGSITYFGRTALHAGPSAEDCVEIHRERVRFLETMRSASPLERIKLRPYRQTVGTVSDSEFLIEKFTGMTRLEGADLHTHLSGCSLVVLDHPGTTLNIAMAWNVPVVGFWSADYHAVSSAAAKLEQALTDVGVLHSSADSAARFLVEKIEDIDSWWHSSPVQQARKAWCQQYARHDPQWRKQWASYINALGRNTA